MVEISTDTARLNVPMIHDFLTQSYWAKGIPLETVEQSIRHSLCFGLYVDGEQTGFARVITDKATFAYVADVFILEAFRGRGLSTQLMETIMAHADLQGLRRIILATRDAHGLYGRFGFVPLAIPDRWMEKHDTNIYMRSR